MLRRHGQVAPIHDFFGREGSLHETLDAGRDDLLDLEWQVLLNEIVSGAIHPEVVVGGVANRLYLICQDLLRVVKLFRLHFHISESSDRTFIL